ncbi:PREDICTED: uncharacterized protein LOC109326305 [Lupinus angustifolius]|uniref:uncharacterized protein LOC109326305 n=1 Tax=Lupinus angustifolius TaxID=3871 RepID=UPI00092FBC27|nr:PREDICTED: uncharacterized protein LOC109326305 [Lupinus angustifolius]
MGAYNIAKSKLKLEFEMSNLGTLSYFLGIEFAMTDERTLMHQRNYIVDVLERFNMLECNPTSTFVETSHTLCKKNPEDQSIDLTLYRKMIGSLRYICNSRHDLAYGVGFVSRHMEHHKHSHMQVVKRILRYLKISMNYGVMFPANKGRELSTIYGYTYAD